MKITRLSFSILSRLITLTFFLFQLNVNAQSKANYSLDKENYRVVAIKDDTNRVESISNVVELVKSTSLFLPNAFTPDQDGLNDKFGAIGLNVEKYELKVFNRWGELLFESNNIDHKWDGLHQGKLVPEGVYVYTLFAKEVATGKRISKSGTVTLLL